ncbi:MAG: hypothetical protein ACJ8IK_00910 [Burkholderiaceae bacterium]
MTKTTTVAALFAACASLAACGGNGDSTPPAPPPLPQTFSYVAPTLGTTDTWTRTLTDSMGTSVSLQLRQRVTQANADGSEVWTYDDPTGVVETHDGLTFRTTPQVDDVAPNGNVVDYTNTHVDGQQVTCIYGPATSAATANAGRVIELAARRAESFSIGQTWTSAYTISCAGQAPITYQATASVIGYETVSVAAGTFRAVKETVVLNYVDNGIASTASTTLWRDPAHWLFTVKSDQAIARDGATAAYFARDQRELSSRQ